MTEHGNAHDSGDCRTGCPHPDHVYDGDLDELDVETLLELAYDDGARWPFDDGLVWDDDEGPVAL